MCPCEPACWKRFAAVRLDGAGPASELRALCAATPPDGEKGGRLGVSWTRAERGKFREGVSGSLEPVSLQSSSGPASVSLLFPVSDRTKPVSGQGPEQTGVTLGITTAGTSVTSIPWGRGSGCHSPAHTRWNRGGQTTGEEKGRPAGPAPFSRGERLRPRAPAGALALAGSFSCTCVNPGAAENKRGIEEVTSCKKRHIGKAHS